jgi:septum formation protein
MTKLTLASRSAARRTMLTQAGLVFDTLDAGVDEDAVKVRMLAEGASPLVVAQALAEAKALAGSRATGDLVIGSDQTLELDGELIDKAGSMAEARARLWRMRGRDHALHSAVALAVEGEIIWRSADTARLSMRTFSERFLDRYLVAQGDNILSSVGCYRLEGLGAQLFERVAGDYFTVLGMPLWPLLAALRERGVIEQ